HETIVADAVARTRDELATTSLAAAFVGPEFTISDLREVYEAAWGVPLDSGNFRRKVLATANFVTPTGRYAAPGPDGGKPAEIYRRGGPAPPPPPPPPPRAGPPRRGPPPHGAPRASPPPGSEPPRDWGR